MELVGTGRGSEEQERGKPDRGAVTLGPEQGSGWGWSHSLYPFKGSGPLKASAFILPLEALCGLWHHISHHGHSLSRSCQMDLHPERLPGLAGTKLLGWQDLGHWVFLGPGKGVVVRLPIVLLTA